MQSVWHTWDLTWHCNDYINKKIYIVKKKSRGSYIIKNQINIQKLSKIKNDGNK